MFLRNRELELYQRFPKMSEEQIKVFIVKVQMFYLLESIALKMIFMYLLIVLSIQQAIQMLLIEISQKKHPP